MRGECFKLFHEVFKDILNLILNPILSVDCTALPPPMESKVYGSAASSSSKSSGSSLHQIIFTVRLEPKGGLLGITLAGSEDITKSITISGLVEGESSCSWPFSRLN